VRAKDSAVYEASFIGFGGTDRLATGHAPVEPRQRQRLGGYAASLRPLGWPSMGGSTPIADVLGEAGSTLEGKRGRAAVVLISDGRADDPDAALEAGRQLVSGYPDEVCIHTIQMGEDPEGRTLLNSLASLSENECGSARNASSLRTEAALADLERNVFFGAAPLPPVAAKPDACSQRIVLRGVQFDLDSAAIRPESGPVLDVAVEQLKDCADLKLAIEGHTCSLGTDAYNQDLSSRRANSVREYLLAQGVAPERLTVFGVGEAGPVASNDNEEGRSQNRRVELIPPSE
jgi:OOP family OmpA-OmpF porin